MKRVGFVLKVKKGPDRRVPPPPRRGLAGDARRPAGAGWHNYSLFLRHDGTLFGYFETPARSPRPRGMSGGGQRPLATGDGALLRGHRRHTPVPIG